MTEVLENSEKELRKACADGDLESAKTTLQNMRRQLSPDTPIPRHLQMPLADAIAGGHTEIVTYLLSQGAQITSLDITQAVRPCSRSVAIFQTFLDHGWDINSPTGTHATALKYVVDSEELTRWFLGHGADPNVGSFSILDVTAANSSPAVLDLLIAHGAKLEESDALHSAAGECEGVPGRVEMMRHLLDDLGADVNAIEKRGVPAGRGLGRGTPLHSAAYAGRKERIVLLLDKGANRERKNTLGQTVVEFAVAQELEEVLELLKGV